MVGVCGNVIAFTMYANSSLETRYLYAVSAVTLLQTLKKKIFYIKCLVLIGSSKNNKYFQNHFGIMPSSEKKLWKPCKIQGVIYENSYSMFINLVLTHSTVGPNQVLHILPYFPICASTGKKLVQALFFPLFYALVTIKSIAYCNTL